MQNFFLFGGLASGRVACFFRLHAAGCSIGDWFRSTPIPCQYRPPWRLRNAWWGRAYPDEEPSRTDCPNTARLCYTRHTKMGSVC